MKVWIDDERPAPSDDFVVCKDIFEVMKLLESLEDSDNRDKRIDFISFDYYIDPKNHRFTGSDAIDEITFHDRCVSDVLSDTFSFATHSSDSECNKRMTEKMEKYLKEKRNNA